MNDAVEFDTGTATHTPIRPQMPMATAATSNVPAISDRSPASMMIAAFKEGIPLDQIEKMMDLQERWEAGEAKKAFTAAMTAFKAEPITILKRKHVSFDTSKGNTSYSHAELSDVTDAIGPALAKHDLTYDWEVRQDGGLITVDCVLTHVRGHSKKVTLSGSPDATGGKNSIQAAASTVTYLERYTLLAVTGMSTKGMDDDGAGATQPEDMTLRDTWISKVNAAKDNESLQAVWQDGLKDIQANGTPADYSALKAVVLALKKGFDAATAQGASE